MIVGFTGTRRGMTDDQKQSVQRLLEEIEDIKQAHHGDCIGSDAQFHEICRQLGITIVIHPPDVDDNRAFCEGDVTHPPQRYLDLNRGIVDSADVMLATPMGYKEQLRSGTWAAIRYARKKSKTIHLVFPDGTVNREDP